MTLVNLGNALDSLGDYNKQLKNLERELVVLEKHYVNDHPEVSEAKA